MLLDWIRHSHLYGADANGLLVRRELTQLTDLIRESHKIYGPLQGWVWKVAEKTWVTPEGARLRFDHLEDDDDADKYLGWSLCVAVGTKIRMADGSLKPIEAIRPTELIQTLEGPRRVLAAIEPYVAGCVRVRVSHRTPGGREVVLGEQVHPTTHPVLSSAGLICSGKGRTRRTALQLHGALACPHKANAEYQRGVHPTPEAWHAWAAKDHQTSYKGKSASHPSAVQPQYKSVPVVLHVPDCGLAAKHHYHVSQLSTSARDPSIWRQWYQLICQAPEQLCAYLALDQGPLLSLVQSFFGHNAPYRFARAVLSCAQPGWQTAPSYQDRCFDGCHPYDARAHVLSGSALTYIQAQDGAGQLYREMIPGELGTIPKYSHSGLWSWVHPYSGEERCLAEPVRLGTMELIGFERALVTDLCVEGANHYIGETGLINKNTWFGVEEITTFPRAQPIFKIMACLRSPNPEVIVNFRATGNPGNLGHNWVKARYVDPAPSGYSIISDPDTDLKRVFIPARARDNKYISPEYLNLVRMSAPNANILKGWLDGDWNFAEGAFFDEWNPDLHVIRNFKIPDHWARYCAVDPGSTDPAAVVWGAVVDNEIEYALSRFDNADKSRAYQGDLPQGAIVIYKEKYFAKAGTDIGLKLSIQTMAEEIRNLEFTQVVRGVAYNEPLDTDGTPKIAKRVAGSDLFNHKNGPSLAEQIAVAPYRLFFYQAERARTASKNNWGGWNLLRWRLQGQDGVPMIYFMETCTNCIKNIPLLQADDANPEDVKNCSYDHAPDAVRYLLQCRPYIPTTYEPLQRHSEIETNNAIGLVGPPPGGWLEDLEMGSTAPRLQLAASKRIQ